MLKWNKSYKFAVGQYIIQKVTRKSFNEGEREHYVQLSNPHDFWNINWSVN